MRPEPKRLGKDECRRSGYRKRVCAFDPTENANNKNKL